MVFNCLSDHERITYYKWDCGVFWSWHCDFPSDVIGNLVQNIPFIVLIQFFAPWPNFIQKDVQKTFWTGPYFERNHWALLRYKEDVDILSPVRWAYFANIMPNILSGLYQASCRFCFSFLRKIFMVFKAAWSLGIWHL